jgi:hypothetical protein
MATKGTITRKVAWHDPMGSHVRVKFSDITVIANKHHGGREAKIALSESVVIFQPKRQGISHMITAGQDVEYMPADRTETRKFTPTPLQQSHVLCAGVGALRWIAFYRSVPPKGDAHLLFYVFDAENQRVNVVPCHAATVRDTRTVRESLVLPDYWTGKELARACFEIAKSPLPPGFPSSYRDVRPKASTTTEQAQPAQPSADEAPEGTPRRSARVHSASATPKVSTQRSLRHLHATLMPAHFRRHPSPAAGLSVMP